MISEDVKLFKEQKNKELSQQCSELKTLKNDFDMIKSENEMLKKEIENLFEENAKLNLKQNNQTDVFALINELNDLNQRFSKHKTFINSIESNLNELKEMKEVFLTENDVWKKQCDEAQEHLLTFENEINRYNKEIESQNVELQSIKNINLVLESEKAELLVKLEKLQLEADENTKINSNLMEDIKKIQSESDKCSLKLQDDCNELNEKFKKLKEENEQLLLEKTKILSLESYKADLDEQLVQLKNELNENCQTIEKLNDFIQIKTVEMDQMKYDNDKTLAESYNLAEDLKNLYFSNKSLKDKLSLLANEKCQILSEKQKIMDELANTQQSLHLQIQEKELLFQKMQISDESQSLFKNLTDKLNDLIESKEVEYREIITSKETTIQELKNQNNEYLQKIQMIQSEKDKLFRNFHELVLNSYKTNAPNSVENTLAETTVIKENSSSLQNNEKNDVIEKESSSKLIEKQSPQKIDNKPESILLNNRCPKRKTNGTDVLNTKIVKVVRFEDNDLNEKSTVDTIPLTRFSRNNRSKAKDKTSIDMSFVRKKLDTDAKNENQKKSNSDPSETEISWIENIYNF